MLKHLYKISDWSINNPKKAVFANVALALILLTIAVLPNIFLSLPLNKLKVDTDPENMLSKTEPVRIFHNQMRKEFGLYDILVVGIVNKNNQNGVYNKASLNKIYDLTEYIKNIDGVITREIISPSTVDSIEGSGFGVVNFDWLMKDKVGTDADALKIFDKANRIPFLNGTLNSEDGKAVAIYIPIKSKNLSYKISKDIKQKVKELGFSDKVFITGLPVAQDTFGVEMFKQMAISAPLAMLFIFILMYLFFRNVYLIASPMIVAMLSVIITMATLIISGNTVHIMSSMIPIFIMPIAVLDAVHILSEFFDQYQKYSNRHQAIHAVMKELFTPMLYTSITTVVGFLSLATTRIPPVVTFGLFVAIGVSFAWVSTVTFIPAFIMLVDIKRFKHFGLPKGAHDHSLTARLLHWFGLRVYHNPKFIIGITIILAIIAAYGMTKITINDNPVKWFTKSHEIRVADKELNKRFSGTYMAYLVFEDNITNDKIIELATAKGLPAVAVKGDSKQEILNNLRDYADEKGDWDMQDKIDALEQELQTFKNPSMLRYIDGLQSYLKREHYIGKSNGLPDVVKTVHRDLMEGNTTYFTIPETREGVAETILTYENSHRASDLWHFVTPDYSKTNLWMQLPTGDNKDMSKIIKAVDNFVKINKPPLDVKVAWHGMTYINVIWQDKMVRGMLKSFLGSFFIVLLLMTILFRSISFGLLSMLPLTITIAFIYGVIGLIGKDYDMPIAVLSSLSLGLAVDYAIHFIARARELRSYHKSWHDTIHPLFGEPARAIFRNVIVISIGFLPLLFAPLMPYKTVGIFISAILFLAGGVTLAILPASMTLMSRWLFAHDDDKNAKMAMATVISIVVIFVATVYVNFFMK